MARSLVTALLMLPSLALAVGCGGSATSQAPAAAASGAQAPAKPPTPTSITRENPGGDAEDPERAALERLASEPWGFRKDHWNTLRVPLADWKNWRRVRIWGHPTRATYRYGDKHRAVDTTLYTSVEGRNDAETCLARFTEYALGTAQSYGVELSEPQIVRMTQQVDGETRPLLVQLREGSIDSILASDEYVGAIAVYPSWPGTCLVRGFAIVSTRHRDLALKIRDRWVREGATGLLWEKRLKDAPPTTAR